LSLISLSPAESQTTELAPERGEPRLFARRSRLVDIFCCGTESRNYMDSLEVKRDRETIGPLDAKDLGAARKIFDLLDARLFLGFRPVKMKKRTLNEINGGW